MDDQTSTIDYFKNLGCTISWDCRDDKEVPIRSAQAKAAFHQLRGILCNKKLSFECRYPVLKCFMCTRFIYIAPRLGPYRSVSRIRSLALKCACAKCKDCQGRPRRSNVDVRKLTCGQASLLKNIKERQLRFRGRPQETAIGRSGTHRENRGKGKRKAEDSLPTTVTVSGKSQLHNPCCQKSRIVATFYK